jgi:LPXTG-site transpeptidase (sortase) family protein
VLGRGLLGYALFCLGGTSVAFAGGRYAMGTWQQKDARQTWQEAHAKAIVAMARRSVDETDRGLPIAPGVPVARLVIPRILLDEIVLEGVDDNTLNAGPGHLPGSAFPGEKGNAIVSAHRDRHFARLGELRVGDTLSTEAGARTELWVITSKRVIDADAPALHKTRDATLTLTTCWPIRYLGTAPERLIVTAKLLGKGEGGKGKV